MPLLLTIAALFKSISVDVARLSFTKPTAFWKDLTSTSIFASGMKESVVPVDVMPALIIPRFECDSIIPNSVNEGVVPSSTTKTSES